MIKLKDLISERVDFHQIATELVKKYKLKSKVKIGTGKNFGEYIPETDTITLRPSYSSLKDFYMTILHEIGHKIVAKYYGCWAEFRSDPQGLKVGVGIAALLGFVFMAPGAVMVAGTVTRRQNGHIAIAGPLVNLSLFLIGIPLGALVYTLLGGSVPSSTSYLVEGGFDWHVMLWDCISFWVTANLILGLFNMLPFGPLDGVKVRDWSYGAWLGLTLVFPLHTMMPNSDPT